MYLTRIKLDMRNRKTVRALANPNLIHGALEKARPGERTRLLWRIDQMRGIYYLLILSPSPLETEALVNQFGFEGEEEEVKSYDPLLNNLKKGMRCRFRLSANPTRSLSSGKYGERGKRAAHVSEKWQRSWMENQSVRHGFYLNPDHFRIVGSRWLNFSKKDGSHVHLKEVVFEGILEITDPESFRSLLIDGLGRGKAYGMGLMTIIPLYE